MHIIWWPISLKRVAGSPAPRRQMTAAQRTRVSRALRPEFARGGLKFKFREFLCANIFTDSAIETYRAAPGGQPRAAVPTFQLLVAGGDWSGLRVLQARGRRNADWSWGVWNQSQHRSA